MIKTLMVSLLLKNTYQVNCIMYAIKQTPIIKHFLPDGFYGSYKVKCFANVLSVLWEIISTFAFIRQLLNRNYFFIYLFS